MSKDIRSYFTSAGSGKKKETKDVEAKLEKTANPQKKKRIAVISDSDDEDVPAPVKKQKSTPPNEKCSKYFKDTKKTVAKTAPVELKPVNAADVFGCDKVKRSATKTLKEQVIEIPAKKPKKEKRVPAATLDDDLDFEATLMQLDEIEAQANEQFLKESQESGYVESSQDPKTAKTHDKHQRKDNGADSGFGESSSQSNGFHDTQEKCDDTSDKQNYHATKTKTVDSVESSRSKTKVKHSISYLSGSEEEVKEPRQKTEKKKKETGKKIREAEEPKKKKKSEEVVEQTEEPKSKKKKGGEVEGKTEEPKIKKKKKGGDEGEEPYWVNDPAEKRRLSAIGYQRYLQREGPKHLGAKEIPEGRPDSLAGLKFVITGVLDSIERDEAAALVARCGGKVTTSVSRNTNYLVVGEDAGPSKVAQAEKLGTRTIGEDELFDLVRTGSCRGKKDAQAPAKDKKGAQEKQETPTDSKHTKTSKTSPAKDKKTTPVKRETSPHSKHTEVSKTTSPKEQKSAPMSPRSKHTEVSKTTSPKEQKSAPVKRETSPRSKHTEVSKTPPGKDVSAPVKQEVSASTSQHRTQSEASTSKTKPISPRPPPQTSKAQRLPPSLMWVDKYRPTTLKAIIGQQGDKSNVKKLLNWLQNWHRNQFGGKKLVKPSPWARDDDGAFFKAALLSGPPGVGKTTSAHLVSKELGLDVVEFNASDTRSKRLLHEEVSELLSNKSLNDYFTGSQGKTTSRHVLLMDEVDGMAGNEDRGGMQELIQLIKNSKVPILCMCNDVHHQKIRSLLGYCFDLRFQKPRVEQIRGAMQSVCFKEGVKIPPDVLTDMITGSNQDVRQVLHHLSLYSAKVASGAKEVVVSKHVKLGPWDVMKKVFSSEEHRTMSINDKSDLFFHDYNISPLFVQENYLSVLPDVAKNDMFKRLDLVAQAANSICMGDTVERCIRSKNTWSLLPIQAMYASVIPGDLLEGHMTCQINFPSWLGKNSRRNKFDRLAQELHSHTRLSASANKQSLVLDYLPRLREAIARPLVSGGAEGVPETIAVLQAYHLLRSDIDSIAELTVWPGEQDPMSRVEGKVKAALTRTYNRDLVLPYSTATSVSKKRSVVVAEGDQDEEGEEGEEEESDDLSADAMIKAKKRPAAPAKEVGAAKRGRGRGKK